MTVEHQMIATPIPVAVSARHIHLTQAAVEHLFGAGHQLQPLHPLSQPGQFAAMECVQLVGPKGTIDKVRVLGPVRAANQVEVSMSDQRILGLHAPVRLSGDVAHSPGIRLVGPMGVLDIEAGVILAHRHIHMSPTDAVFFGVKHGQQVAVCIKDPERELVFADVCVRVSEDFRLEMHIDTDEGNAAGVEAHAVGYIIKSG